MEKHILEKMVDDRKSTREIAKALNLGQTSVRWWLRHFDLKTNPKTGQKGCSKPLVCKCGEKDPSKFYGKSKSICGNCHNEYTKNIGKKKRVWAINKLGGSCVECGYNKYNCSLDIHHLYDKDPNFASMRGWSYKRIEEELKKCKLYCKCCHAALHAGEL